MSAVTPLTSCAPVAVTGGAAGLGRAVVTRLDALGGAVSVLDRRRSPDGLPTEIVDLADARAAEDGERVVAVNLVGTAAGVTMLTPGGMHTAFFDEREERYKPPADLRLADPGDVAEAVAFALTRPPGCEVRELVVTPPNEESWP